MGKYKLVAVDLDDTLLNKEMNITEHAIKVVRQVRERGINITLATGRMFCSAKPYAEQLGINLPLITYQGALVKEMQSSAVLLHHTVPLELAKQLITDIKKKHNYHINVYIDDQLYAEELTPEGQRYQKICRIKMNTVGDMLKFLNKPPTKILVSASEQQVDALMQELKPVYGKQLHVTKSKAYFLEFSHPKANKGEALAMLAGRLGVERDQIMAIGDGYNDVEMLDYAGTGVVVANARDEIKKLADYVTLSNERDGVADVLEKLVLV